MPVIDEVIHSLERGFVHPGWRLTRLYKLSAIDTHFVYWIKFTNEEIPTSQIDLVVAIRHGVVNLKRAILWRGRKLSAYKEVLEYEISFCSQG